MLLYRRADCNKCNASIPNWYLRDGYYLRLGKGNWSVLLADDDKFAQKVAQCIFDPIQKQEFQQTINEVGHNQMTAYDNSFRPERELRGIQAFTIS